MLTQPIICEELVHSGRFKFSLAGVNTYYKSVDIVHRSIPLINHVMKNGIEANNHGIEANNHHMYGTELFSTT